jgi:hypothetical protein
LALYRLGQYWLSTVYCPNILRLLKHINMTIHRKALDEHFLVVPLVFRFNHFREKHFLNFSPKKPSPLSQRVKESDYKIAVHWTPLLTVYYWHEMIPCTCPQVPFTCRISAVSAIDAYWNKSNCHPTSFSTPASSVNNHDPDSTRVMNAMHMDRTWHRFPSGVSLYQSRLCLLSWLRSAIYAHRCWYCYRHITVCVCVHFWLLSRVQILSSGANGFVIKHLGCCILYDENYIFYAAFFFAASSVLNKGTTPVSDRNRTLVRVFTTGLY